MIDLDGAGDSEVSFGEIAHSGFVRCRRLRYCNGRLGRADGPDLIIGIGFIALRSHERIDILFLPPVSIFGSQKFFEERQPRIQALSENEALRFGDIPRLVPWA